MYFTTTLARGHISSKTSIATGSGVLPSKVTPKSSKSSKSTKSSATGSGSGVSSPPAYRYPGKSIVMSTNYFFNSGTQDRLVKSIYIIPY